MEELDNANGIHAFNRFEEKGYVERFQCHFRLFDIWRAFNEIMKKKNLSLVTKHKNILN